MVMTDQYLPFAIKAASEAGAAIMEVFYSADFGTTEKEDNSPLTRADLAANKVIASVLRTSNLPILSEESEHIPYEERKGWKLFWLVDPLDGTKSFINKEPDFTVNIALIENNRPVLGVVFLPYEQKIYWATTGGGAFVRVQEAEPAHIHATTTHTPVRVVASKNHMNEETQSFIATREPYELLQYGSSRKILAVAEGLADLYPRFGLTSEWDTAAADAIATEAGCHMYTVSEKTPLLYNKENILNPFFIVAGL